jgi:hypothetical protein
MENIKIDYNGRYPNLCSGTLVVTIGEKVWNFGENVLSSSGSVSFDEQWNEEVTSGPWGISDWPKGFPKKYRAVVEDAINDQIPWGCCGGCV